MAPADDFGRVAASTRAAAMRHLLCAVFLCSALCAASAPALAEKSLQCRVRSVHDGDSLRVQCPGRRATTELRLRQIDAPELGQPYGTQARDRLRRLCPADSAITIRHPGRDQYGRMLGDVYCDARDVNEEMVASGAAWPYDRHVEDRKLFWLKEQARSARRGLWANDEPVPPWRWRYHQRQGD